MIERGFMDGWVEKCEDLSMKSNKEKGRAESYRQRETPCAKVTDKMKEVTANSDR